MGELEGPAESLVGVCVSTVSVTVTFFHAATVTTLPQPLSGGSNCIYTHFKLRRRLHRDEHKGASLLHCSVQLARLGRAGPSLTSV